MKLQFIMVVLCVVTKVICGPAPQHQINNEHHQQQDEKKHAIEKFTNGLVENPKIRENYLNCFLDNGPCSPKASSIKQMIPEAIQKECAHCTELQKKVIEKMMCYLNNHQPEILKQVAAKFDPNGEYMKQYIKTIEKKGNDDLNSHQHRPQEKQHQSQQHELHDLQQNQHQSQHQQQSKKEQTKTTETTTPKATETQKP